MKDIKELSPVGGLGREAFLDRDKKFEYVRVVGQKGEVDARSPAE